MKKILLIDKGVTENHTKCLLKGGYEVEAVKYIKTAIINLYERKIKYDLIILEIMLENQGLFSKEESSDGLLTGIFFYKELLKELNVPVLFWTWNEDFAENVAMLKSKNPESKIGFATKTIKNSFMEADAGSLLDSVKKFLDEKN